MNSNYPPETMPWWKSKVIVGALISILAKLFVISGLTGEITPGETQQVTDLVLIVIGGLGDLLAIGSRITQRYAPQITGGDGGGGSGFGSRGLPVLLACALLFPLAACSTLQNVPTAPSEIADQTRLDEQAALTLTLAYTGAAKAATLAIETGIIDSPATIARIGELDRQAFAAVLAAERAYNAGNAASYASALMEARLAISGLLTAVQGDAS